jgi:hypothetical protein
VKAAAVIALGLMLLLAGCGEPTASAPSASPTNAVMRDLKTGESVSLASGLTLTVPAGYDGWYGSGGSDVTGELDVVASNRLAQSSPMHSFSAASLTATATPVYIGLPLIASTGDGQVEVRAAVVHRGTPKATSLISILVTVPGRPRGQVSLMVVGKEASDDPAAVLDQAESLWRLFNVQGASLPSAKE